jgi:hypothetical protein
MGFQNMRQTGTAMAAIAGLGALLVGCGSQNSGFARTDAGSGFGGQVQPMAVSCEPTQRAVVRQVAVNGGFQAQVQCETVNGLAVGTAGYGATPVAYQPGVQPVNYLQPAPAALDDTRFARAAAPQVVTREAAPQRVAYQRAPERIVKPTRSVKKSAIIIGSSAGAGAGLGAVIGGKKGAGIGALIGGGGAALWDQITRRK